MKISSEDVSPIEKKLVVEVDPAAVDKELERAYRALSRKVSIRGFRPGKAPRRVLEQQFKDQVESEVRQTLVQETLPEALKERGLNPITAPAVRLESLRAGTPFRYHAKVELKPKIEIKDYKGLPFKPIAVEVVDAQVDAEIDRIRQNASQLVPVGDRDRVMQGDFVVVDYSGSIEGTPLKGTVGENVTFEVAPGKFYEGHAPELQGSSVGDSRDIDVKFPGDYRAQNLRGKKVTFKMAVRGLKKREAPALDDEFAKDVGAKDLAELRARVKEDLLTRAKEQAERDERDQLMKVLAERNPFDIPSGMVERAINQIIEAGAERLSQSGVDLRKVQLDMPKLREEMRDRAAFEVRAALLLEAVAKAEKIEPTDADVDARIEEVAAKAKQPVAKVRAQVDRNAIRARLTEEKAVASLRHDANAETK
jgi:trigger factor